MWTCVICKGVFETKDLEGCMKHPYCKKCFKEVWNDNYYDYFRWLNGVHNKLNENVH